MSHHLHSQKSHAPPHSTLHRGTCQAESAEILCEARDVELSRETQNTSRMSCSGGATWRRSMCGVVSFTQPSLCVLLQRLQGRSTAEELESDAR